MGYALPAALGAKLACPGRQVVAVCGDGAFQMAMMELATANQHGVPVKLVVMRNDMLGMVREIQQREYRGRETAAALAGGPEIGGIAGAYGVPFDRIDSMEEAGAAVERFLADGRFVYPRMCRRPAGGNPLTGGKAYETDHVGAGGK